MSLLYSLARHILLLTPRFLLLALLALSMNEGNSVSGASPPSVRILVGHELDVVSLAYSPDGRLLVSGEQGKTVIVWDVTNRRALRRFGGHGLMSLSSVAFSPDGSRVASASSGVVRVWNVKTGRVKVVGHRGGVRLGSILFTPDGRSIIASADGMIHLINLDSGGISRTLQGKPVIWSLSLSRDGATLVSGENDGVGVWDFRLGVLRQRLGEGDKYVVYQVALSPDGRWVAAYFAYPRAASELRAWDLLVPGAEEKMLSKAWGITGLAFSPDSRLLAAGSIEADKPLDQAKARVLLWDIRTGAVKAALPLKDFPGPVAYSPDNMQVAVGVGKTVILWRQGARSTR